MANITKRVNKKLADRLQPGETIRIAILCEPKDTYGKGAAGLVIAPGLQLRRLGKKAKEEREEEGGTAASFPARSCVLAVTDHRILVVDSNGLTFKDTRMEIPLGSVLVGEISKSGLGKRLELVFADGSKAAVDTQRGQPLDDLASTLGRAG